MIRLILGSAISAVVMALATPVPAQQAAGPASDSPFPAIVRQWQDAYNRKDAATIGALYSEDALWVLPGSLAMGRDAIQKHLEGDFKAGLYDIRIHEIEEHVVGDAAWLIGEWDVHTPGQNGADA